MIEEQTNWKKKYEEELPRIINKWSGLLEMITHFRGKDLEKLCEFAHLYSLNASAYASTSANDNFLPLNLKVLDRLDSLEKVEIMHGPVCAHIYKDKTIVLQSETMQFKYEITDNDTSYWHINKYIKEKSNDAVENYFIEKISEIYKDIINSGKTLFIYTPIEAISLISSYNTRFFTCRSRFAGIDLDEKLAAKKDPEGVITVNKFNKEMKVRRDLLNKHREYCLCWKDCEFFKPNTSENCEVAQKLYQFDIDNNVTTPVWECEKYKAKD